MSPLPVKPIPLAQLPLAQVAQKAYSSVLGLPFQVPNGERVNAGPLTWPIRAISTAQALTVADLVVHVTTGGGALIVTLPSASIKGLLLHIKKVDSGVGAVTVTPAGADTIEGAANQSLAAQYNSTTLIAGGAGIWYKVATT